VVALNVLVDAWYVVYNQFSAEVAIVVSHIIFKISSTGFFVPVGGGVGLEVVCIMEVAIES
jgi:hypothetical protein